MIAIIEISNSTIQFVKPKEVKTEFLTNINAKKAASCDL